MVMVFDLAPAAPALNANFSGGALCLQGTVLQVHTPHGHLASAPLHQSCAALQGSKLWTPAVTLHLASASLHLSPRRLPAGDWVVDAFATAAPRPRGSVVGQDFFRAKLIPADTDFRMFSW